MKNNSVISPNKEEFRANRSGGIGSSDIAAVMGVDPYRTPYQLWLEKTGREERSGDNKFTIAGTRMEGVVAEYFEDQLCAHFNRESLQEITFFHPQHDYLLASPDRHYQRVQGDQLVFGLLECKTTQKNIDPEFLPEQWFCQNQYQAAIVAATGRWQVDECAVAWFFRGLDFNYHLFEYDPAFGDMLLNEAGEFWVNYVLKDIPPPLHGAADVEKAFPRHRAGKVIKASDELMQEYEQLVKVRAQIKELQDQEEAIKERFKVIMQDAEAVEYFDEILVTWRASKPVRRLDTKRLRDEQPDVFERYAREYPPTRPFLVK